MKGVGDNPPVASARRFAAGGGGGGVKRISAPHTRGFEKPVRSEGSVSSSFALDSPNASSKPRSNQSGPASNKGRPQSPNQRVGWGGRQGMDSLDPTDPTPGTLMIE